MKNKLNKIGLYLLCGVFISITSCEDELALAPLSELTAGNFYKTEQHLNEALTAIYDGLQDFYAEDLNYIVLPRSDDTPQIGLKMDNLEGNISQFNETPGSSILSDAWSRAYNIIWRSNIVIERAPEVEFADPVQQKAVIDQARFFRALIHFELVRIWGDVPLITRSLGLEESFSFPRTPSAEVYSFVISELEALAGSSSGLPAANSKGRPTTFAASGILARAYMFQQDYSNALKHLETIINSGNYQFYDDWSEIFKESNDNGPHSIFSIEFVTGVTGEGNPFPSLGPRNPSPVSLPFGGSDRDFDGSEDLWYSYSEKDIRRDLTLKKGFISVDDGAVDTTKIWNIKYSINNIPSGFREWGINWPVLRYTDVLMMQAEILNEQSYPNSQALEVLNMVRTRAGLDATDFNTLHSKDAFFDELLHQRRLEFAFEGIRWYDLLRTGKDVEILSAFALSQFPYQEYRSLMPIPSIELTKVADEKILWQNPGY